MSHGDRCVTKAISSKTVMPTTFKGITDRPAAFAKGAVLPYCRFGYNQKGNQENVCIILLFLEWNCSRWGGVGAESQLESESEIESLEIRRLRSPGRVC